MLVYCDQTVGRILIRPTVWSQYTSIPPYGSMGDLPLDGGRPRPTPHMLAHPAPLPQKAHSPHFRPMSDVAKQMDGPIIKMPLGMAVGLGPVHIVLDGDPSPPPPTKKVRSHQFSAPVFCGQTVAHLSN